MGATRRAFPEAYKREVVDRVATSRPSAGRVAERQLFTSPSAQRFDPHRLLACRGAGLVGASTSTLGTRSADLESCYLISRYAGRNGCM